MQKISNQNPWQRFLQWFDSWGLFSILVFLVCFIPMYPKLPLFDIIPGYIVRVRLEDIFVAVAVVILGIQLARHKASIANPIQPFLYWYVVAGLAALVSGVLIVKTIPLELLHISKSVLHFLRYLEYFSLFLLSVSAIQTKRQAKILVVALITGMLIVTLYGIGQKYLYWPVYSTMNREFSKGIRLYLTEHARVQSTFGGHYDLAAYLVVLLPLLQLVGYATTKRASKVVIWTLYILGVWLITVSASRTSFAAFAVCAGLTVALVSYLKQRKGEAFRFFLSRGLGISIVIVSIFWSFGEDIRERLLQTVAAYPSIYEPYQSASEQVSQIVADTAALLPKDFMPTAPPPNSVSTEELEAMVASDQQPSPTKPESKPRPTDVYTDTPDLVEIATISATGAATTTIVEQPRTWSDAALKHGLSLAIRLDTLWPQAIQGFYRNPVFGSGYATLTKSTVTQFTEAESTDNNFLRTLGETGLFGFATFYGAIVLSAVYGWKLALSGPRNTKLSLETVLGFGFLVATIGLLLNAIYIDVYASSKVAFVYWSYAGMVIAVWKIQQHSPEETTKSAVRKLKKATNYYAKIST